MCRVYPSFAVVRVGVARIGRWTTMLLLLLGVMIGNASAQTMADVTVPASGGGHLTMRLWIPDGVQKIRGVIAVAHGLGGNYLYFANPQTDPDPTNININMPFQPGDLAFQMVAQRHAFALAGLYFDNGTPTSSVDSLNDALNVAALDTTIKHPELATAPVATYGMSNGSGWALMYADWYPNRCIAFAHNKGESIWSYNGSGTDPAIRGNITAAEQIPGLLTYGENDGVGSFGPRTRVDNIKEVFQAHRPYGALWNLIIDYGLGHDENGYGRYFSAAFLDHVIEMRLPSNWAPGSAPTLTPLTGASGWYGAGNGDKTNWSNATPPGIGTMASAQGNINNANYSWFPDEYLARAWQAIVTGPHLATLGLPTTTYNPKTVAIVNANTPYTFPLTVTSSYTLKAADWYDGSTKVQGFTIPSPYTNVAGLKGTVIATYGVHPCAANYSVVQGTNVVGISNLALLFANRLQEWAPAVTTLPSITPTVVNVDQWVTCSVRANDPDGSLEKLLTYTWSATGPGTVAFSAVNGTNAGKDTAAKFPSAGTYAVQVVVSDAEGLTAVKTLSVKVVLNVPPVVTAGAISTTTTVGVPLQLTGTVLDDGLPVAPSVMTITWSKFSGPLLGIVTFANDNPHVVGTTATFSVAGTYVLQLTANDGLAGDISSQVTITVSAASVPAPVVTSATLGGVIGTTFSYSIVATGSPSSYAIASGTLPNGLSLNGSTITGTPTVAVTSTVTVSATNGVGTGFASITIVVVAASSAPVINTTTSFNLTAGEFFTTTVSATGAPISSYTATNLPDGLTLATTTGVISGTPTAAGSWTATISAANSVGTGTAVLVNFTIVPAVPVFSSAATATATLGVPYQFAVTTAPVVQAFTATGLPFGLSIDGTSGLISGTPSVSGVYWVSLTATNDTGTGVSVLKLTVPALGFDAPVLTNAVVIATLSRQFSYAIQATNNPTSYVATTPLPNGLTLDPSTGVVYGVPTAMGTTPVTIAATNAAGSGAGTLTFTVGTAIPEPTPSPVDGAGGWGGVGGCGLGSGVTFLLGGLWFVISVGLRRRR